MESFSDRLLLKTLGFPNVDFEQVWLLRRQYNSSNQEEHNDKTKSNARLKTKSYNDDN